MTIYSIDVLLSLFWTSLLFHILGYIWIQYNSYQITNGIFHIKGTKHFCWNVWKHKRPWLAKVILKRNREQSWKNQAPWLETILQSYSRQNSMTLTSKQLYRSMEQDRKPRNKPMHCGWLIYHKGGKNINGAKKISSVTAGKTEQLHIKE